MPHAHVSSLPHPLLRHTLLPHPLRTISSHTLLQYPPATLSYRMFLLHHLVTPSCHTNLPLLCCYTLLTRSPATLSSHTVLPRSPATTFCPQTSRPHTLAAIHCHCQQPRCVAIFPCRSTFFPTLSVAVFTYTLLSHSPCTLKYSSSFVVCRCLLRGIHARHWRSSQGRRR